MTELFDPYYRWLGISTKERPPNHYRLLGLELFESDLEVIDSIASRHIDSLQEINDGPHLKQSQQLLNELAAARRCLLDPTSKAAYDAELREKNQPKRKPPKAVRPPQPPPPAEPAITAPPAVGSQPPVHHQADSQPHARHDRRPPVAVAAKAKSTRSKSTRHAPPRRRLTPLAIAGSVAVLAVIVIGAWWVLGRDVGDQKVTASAGGTGKLDSTESPIEPSVPQPKQADDAQGETEDGFPTEEPLDGSGMPFSSNGEGAVHSPAAATGSNDTERAADPQWDALIPMDGLRLWLDASAAGTLELATDQRIRGWTDKSMERHQAEADRADFRPELAPSVLGGWPVVRFSGTQWIEISGTSTLFESPTDYTLIFVARGALGTLLSKGTGETDSSFSMSSGVASFRAGDRDLGADASGDTDFHVRSVVADATSLRWYIDGDASGSHDLPHEIGKTNILRIGCTYRNRQGPEALFQGELAELIVYNRTLDDEERAVVEQCLTEKWLSGEAVPFPFDLPEPSIASTEDAGPDAASELASDAQGQPDSPMDAPDEIAADAPADSRPHESRYVVLEPVTMTASAGTGLRLRDDGAVLCDDKATGDETIHITLNTSIPGITAILLEALPDDSLPGKGPGLGLAGAFSLAEFSVTAGPQDESQPVQNVSFSSAVSEDASGAERLIDGDTKTSWTVRRRGQVTRVVFFPRTPIGDEAGTKVDITLANRDVLGCFRILVTSASNPRILTLGDQPHAEGGDGALVLRVNLSGKAWQEPGVGRWVESIEYDGETFGHEGGRKIKADGIKHPVFGTAQQGINAFRAIVPNGSYEVQLYFSEHWTTEVGRRLFSVFIEQQPVLKPVNVFRAPGLGAPYIYKIPNVNVADGRLDIDFKKAGEDTTTILNGVIIQRTR